MTEVINFIKSDYELIIKVVTAIGGLYIFFRGIIEYGNSNRTKQAEFLEKLIAGFESPKLNIAVRMLDDYNCSEADPIGEQRQGIVNLTTVLRDHRESPVTSKDEIYKRDSFCALLDYLSKLNYYLKNNLISKDEIGYFRYYVDKVKGNEAIRNYIRSYYYATDFDRLFEVTD